MPTSFPYIGLRAFQSDQADIFFGREKQTDELLRKLSVTRFLGVVGPSGCGKSSLVMAGMISALETGFMATAGSNWVVATMRPGSHPIRRLTEALLNAGVPENYSSDENNFPFLEATLRRGPLGLIEALTEKPFQENTNLLVLVDQFEELFRFRNMENQNEQDAFVELLLETTLQRELPIYVVITMRSDYLGDCALFPGLPEALNKSQYLTPRMDRNQRMAAIVGPARVFGGDVEPSLVNRLLNETGNDPNQLPVLQHILMRMWQESDTKKTAVSVSPFLADAPAETMGHFLKEQDYEAVGKFSGALSMHADQAFNSLKKHQKFIAEIIFRSLCEGGGGRRDGRHPTAIKVIADRARVSVEEVIEVVEVFRDQAFGFLVPPPREKLYTNTVIDITHESLIRLWKRLRSWVEKETEASETYLLLDRRARRWKKGWGALYGTPDLEIALKWQEKECPTKAWSDRYGGNFELAMEFLNESHGKRKKEETEAQEKYRRELCRAKRFFIISFSLLAICLIALLIYWDLEKREHAAYYASFHKEYGIPVGDGEELSASERKHRAVSYKIVKKGRWGDDRQDIIRMEAVNSDGKLTSYNSYGTYFEPFPTKSPTRECKWRYVMGENGIIQYEEAINRFGDTVWILMYSPQTGMRTTKRDAVYLYPVESNISDFEQLKTDVEKSGENNYFRPESETDDFNQPMADSDNAQGDSGRMGSKHSSKEKAKKDVQQAIKEETTKVNVKTDQKEKVVEKLYNFDFSDSEVMNIWYNANGCEVQIRYRDGSYNPAEGPYNAYGQRREYDSNRRVEKITSIDQNNQVMNDSFGNAIFKITEHDKFGNVLSAELFDAKERPVLCVEGWQKYTAHYNDFGVVEYEDYYNIEGELIPERNKYCKIKYEQDNKGNIIRLEYYNIDGNLVAGPEGFAGYAVQYDEDGNTKQIAYLGADGNWMMTDYGYAGISMEYDDYGNVVRMGYLRANGNLMHTEEYDKNRNVTRMEYYGEDGNPVIDDDWGYAGYNAEYDKNGNIKKMEYFGVDGKLMMTDYGYAGYTAEYNDDGMAIKERYYGSDRKPMINYFWGCAGYNAEYDTNGNVTNMEYYGIDDKLMTTDYGYAGYVAEYNEDGLIEKEEYYGVDRKPVASNYGYAGYIAEYNDDGLITKEWYYGADRKPVVSDYGYAGYTAEYNDDGLITKEWYYGVDRKPVVTDYGYAGYGAEYNGDGLPTMEEYYGADGNLIITEYGYSGYTAEYNDDGLETKVTYYGVDRKPVVTMYDYAGYFADYDNRGNIVKIGYLGTEQELIISNEGYAVGAAQYDFDGNQTRVEYFDTDENLIMSNSGYAVWSAKYNSYGNIISEIYFDEKRNPTITEDGYAKINYEYDENGNMVLEEYLGTENQLVMNRYYEYARLIFKYDTNGNKIYEEYQGADGELVCPSYYGYAIMEAEYDSLGIIKETYKDENNQIVSPWDYWGR